MKAELFVVRGQNCSVPLRCTPQFSQSRQPFLCRSYTQGVIPISARRPAGRNRKIWASPHAHIFLQTQKGKKQKRHKNPCTPPLASEQFIPVLKPVKLCVLQQAKCNTIRQNSGFSVIRQVRVYWQRPNFAYPKVYASPSARGSGNHQTTQSRKSNPKNKIQNVPSPTFLPAQELKN